jgi:hypothetical protein
MVDLVTTTHALLGRSSIGLIRYNTSKTFVAVQLKLDPSANETLNIGKIDKDDFLEQLSPPINYSKEELQFKLNSNKELVSPTTSEDFDFLKHKKNYNIIYDEKLDKKNTFFHYSISGYDENRDFHRYVDKEAVENHEYKIGLKMDFLHDKSDGLKVLIPPHLVGNKQQFLVNASDFLKNLPEFNKERLSLTKEFFYYYNKDVLKYKFLDKDNQLIFDREDFKLRDYLMENRHKYDKYLKTVVDDVEHFYQKNLDLYNDSSKDTMLHELIQKIPIHNDVITAFINYYSSRLHNIEPIKTVNKKIDLDEVLNNIDQFFN